MKSQSCQKLAVDVETPSIDPQQGSVPAEDVMNQIAGSNHQQRRGLNTRDVAADEWALRRAWSSNLRPGTLTRPLGHKL